ncbi:MAG: tRNA (5-methylaminomethyl-2-thiouridine)(34)-methyltransferase MnmD [Alphaproteobacteria bacterium]
MALKPEGLEVSHGRIVAHAYGDAYFSKEDGLAETRHVFLGGNNLPARWEHVPAGKNFCVAELGFGTGLNFLGTVQAWRAAGRTNGLRYVGFEKFPLTCEQMATVLNAWPELADVQAELLAALAGRALTEGFHALRVGAGVQAVELLLAIGDARDMLPLWPDWADAWYLDGFNPKTNAELWEPALLEDVCHHTVNGGTCATYSAASHVRKTLQAVGFTVEKRKGFGKKREMLAGVKSKATRVYID